MRAVRLWVRAGAPLRRTYVSRTTVSAGSADGLVDDDDDRGVAQLAGPLAGALDQRVELVVGQASSERSISSRPARVVRRRGRTSPAKAWRSASERALISAMRDWTFGVSMAVPTQQCEFTSS